MTSTKPLYYTLFFFLFILASLDSCKHDPSPSPAKPPVLADTTHHDTTTCDTTNVKFSVQVKNVLSANCLRCHGSTVYTTKGSGYNFENYNVIAGEANNGDLAKAINHAPGAVPMPTDQTDKISDCSIRTLMIWIGAGAPNN